VNMPRAEMRQLRKHYRANRLRKRAEKFARMRAAKETKRVAGLTAEPVMPDFSHCTVPIGKPSGFRVTIECLDDGERSSFTSFRSPWGDQELSISPTLAGKKVAQVLTHYVPQYVPSASPARARSISRSRGITAASLAG